MYLMEFLWGINHKNFPNMCPYFWLSVVNVILSPLLIPIIGTFKALRKLNERLVERKKVKRTEEKETRIARYLSLIRKGELNADIEKAIKYETDYYSLSGNQRAKGNEIFSTIRRSISREDSVKWIDLLEQRRKSLEQVKDIARVEQRERDRAYNELINKKRKRKGKRRAVWNKITKPFRSKYTKQQLIGMWTVRIKFVFNVLKYALLIVLSAGVAWGLHWLYFNVSPSTWDWRGIGKALGAVGIGILVVGAVIGIIALIRWIVLQLNLYFTRKPIKITWLKYILYIFYPFIIFKWIYLGIRWCLHQVRAFWRLLMSLKKDNCPAIEWE